MKRSQKDRGEDEDGTTGSLKEQKGWKTKITGGEDTEHLKSKANGRTTFKDRNRKGVVLKNVRVSQELSSPRNGGQ